MYFRDLPLSTAPVIVALGSLPHEHKESLRFPVSRRKIWCASGSVYVHNIVETFSELALPSAIERIPCHCSTIFVSPLRLILSRQQSQPGLALRRKFGSQEY